MGNSVRLRGRCMDAKGVRNGEPVECTRGRMVNVREVVHFQAATGREES